MLPTGHVSIGYLIANIPYQKKNKLKWYEVVFIIFCANIFDLDFLLPRIIGFPMGTHHYLPTHTPLIGLLYFLILYFLLRKRISPKTFVLAAVAMLSHLMLDDLAYWMSLIHLEAATRPQIFWLYPFDKRMEQEINNMWLRYRENPWTDFDVFRLHVLVKPKLFWLEIILSISAISVFIKNNLHKSKKKR